MIFRLCRKKTADSSLSGSLKISNHNGVVWKISKIDVQTLPKKSHDDSQINSFHALQTNFEVPLTHLTLQK